MTDGDRDAMFSPYWRLAGRWSRVVSRGGLQGPSWRLGLPEAVLAEEGVEQADEPTHDGHKGGLVGLAVGGEALVAGLGGRLATDRGQGSHVEQMAGLGAAPPDGAVAAVLAGVAVEGGEAQQRGGLMAAEGAEFGHVGTEASSVDRAEARDGLNDGVTTGEPGVGGDAGAHAAVAVGDVGLEGIERGGGAGSSLGVEFGAELAQGAKLLDELAAEGEQVAEQAQVGWFPSRGRGRSGRAWRHQRGRSWRAGRSLRRSAGSARG